MLLMDNRGIASGWGGWEWGPGDSQPQRGSRNNERTGAKKDNHPALVEEVGRHWEMTLYEI